ncbi:MAG: hypothetical protein V4696_03485 [Pseudomonadota bacterium]
MTFEEILALGAKAQQLVGGARDAFKEFKDASSKIRPTLGDKDQASLDARLEAVHAETLTMSQELEDAANKQLGASGR